MKQYLTSDQTAMLIELGYEVPFPKWVKMEDGNCRSIEVFSIGELIEMLPTHINWTPRVILLNSIEYSFGAVDSELFIFNLYDELIDNLFDAVVKLKKKGMI